MNISANCCVVEMYSKVDILLTNVITKEVMSNVDMLSLIV